MNRVFFKHNETLELQGTLAKLKFSHEYTNRIEFPSVRQSESARVRFV